VLDFELVEREPVERDFGEVDRRGGRDVGDLVAVGPFVQIKIVFAFDVDRRIAALGPIPQPKLAFGRNPDCGTARPVAEAANVRTLDAETALLNLLSAWLVSDSGLLAPMAWITVTEA